MGRAAKGEGSIFPVDKGYRGYITVNGRRKYASGSKKTEVAQKLREMKNQRDTGVLAVGRSPRLSDWIDHWLKATQGEHKMKTHAGYQAAVDSYLPTWLGDLTLAKLTAEHLEDAYATLLQKYAGSTVNQLHTVIRASLSLAEKRGKVPVNVARLVVSQPKAAPQPVQPLSDADLDQIYAALNGTDNEARWMLALELGMRPGEAIALEWSHVDFDEGSIAVRQQLQLVEKKLRLVPYTKTDAGMRKIPMPDHLADALKTHRNVQLEQQAKYPEWGGWRDEDEAEGVVHAFVFTSARKPGCPITPSGDTQQWGRVLDAAGLPRVSRYTARHTAASRMIAAGIDLTVVAEILGHANINVLIRVYAHALEERKKAAAGLLEAAWTRGAAPYPAPYGADSDRIKPGQAGSR
jgi:integrase